MIIELTCDEHNKIFIRNVLSEVSRKMNENNYSRLDKVGEHKVGEPFILSYTESVYH